MAALARHPPARTAIAEFLDWDAGDRSGARWQLIDGEPGAMAPASQQHAALLVELGRLLGNHLLAKGSPAGCSRSLGSFPA